MFYFLTGVTLLAILYSLLHTYLNLSADLMPFYGRFKLDLTNFWVITQVMLLHVLQPLLESLQGMESSSVTFYLYKSTSYLN